MQLTTSDLLTRGTALLAPLLEWPNLDAGILLAFALNIPRVRLKSHPETPRTPADLEHYLALIERRAQGEPLAYITGTREFWTLDLRVTRDVLVPRPETELLVERALQLGPTAAARVADLGTGCGAIALALAVERPAWEILAVDASAAALAVAADNARRLGLTNLIFDSSDWFSALTGQRFAVIVSNPPYVDARDPALRALRYEPQQALTPGEDALADLRAIIRAAPDQLLAGGWLALEHGATQASAVAHELVARGFGSVRSHRDLGGHERVTEGQWTQDCLISS
ncbi:MAG TPA: peptide chain release factor N(5)-glutamine methyltransferase [Steroidobacteraceae bacterium]|nr:peptide chain release factor N(5)-glutamine methyltransferase [Steroidobacteraceae bacterium]